MVDLLEANVKDTGGNMGCNNCFVAFLNRVCHGRFKMFSHNLKRLFLVINNKKRNSKNREII